ncbi:signal recognition particle-docking protein FtsY [Williamsia sterculiae]|uniref:signal recognition particle-docking protein FtsY n=1 Tax=Williamsia sterculiae TaxID=1344003 RepID=UPI00097105CE|nr:signal recognition particle-docking protein FtsY [Williamsia sterculiae]
MNTGIIIAIVAAAVIVLVALIALGVGLRRRRRVSLRDGSEQQSVVDGTRQVDKPGGYQASSGFAFSQGGGTGLAEPPARTPETPQTPAGPPTPPTEAPPTDDRTETDGQPMVGDDAAVPRDAERRGFTDVGLPDAPTSDAPTAGPATAEPPTSESATVGRQVVEPATVEPPVVDDTTVEPPVTPDTTVEPPVVGDAVGVETVVPAPAREEIAPSAGRLQKLRGRLARSQGVFGEGVLGLLGAGDLDEESWEEIEDTLVLADLGTATTTAVVEDLRAAIAANPVRTADDARALFRGVLIDHVMPELDRSVRALPHAGTPAVLLVVGVNGTGKTTTTGKLARVLVADGRRVLLGAADTFRAAAADQLQTWGERVGAGIVRGAEGADPASVAFDAVSAGVAEGVDVVMIDTAGRLHTKTGLMDELGKVKRVVEKKAPVDEVLLVLDATIGQNGLAQARVFAEVVDISGVVLTKLDGTAKGGIVFHVQNELGVPVKLVGLGEGADDLAPFEPEAFVDALLG